MNLEYPLLGAIIAACTFGQPKLFVESISFVKQKTVVKRPGFSLHPKFPAIHWLEIV